MRIYLASPIFTETEIANIRKTETILRSQGHTVFSPSEQSFGDHKPGTQIWSMTIFNEDRKFIDWAECVVMLYYGAFSDSGTAWEAGYAYGTNKPVVVVHCGKDSNLMVHEGCHTNITLEELETYDFTTMPVKPYTGEMF